MAGTPEAITEVDKEAETPIAPDEAARLATWHREQAIRLALDGRFVESEACSREALRIRPDDVDAMNELGVAVWRQNRELEAEVSRGAFRADLYYRLNVIEIRLPPLRQRREDIPLLANQFLKKYATAAGRSILRVHAGSVASLCDYEWPGNVRQLENTVERAVALETTDELHVELPLERPKARAVDHSTAAKPTAAKNTGASTQISR